MAPLPLVKLGSLLIKTLAKPVAKKIKSQAGEPQIHHDWVSVLDLDSSSYLSREKSKSKLHAMHWFGLASHLTHSQLGER